MKNRKIVMGVVLALEAVGLLIAAFVPDIALANIPVWKIIVGAAMVYFILDDLICGKHMSKRFEFFIPLAVLFLIFEREIGTSLGIGPNIANNWIILAVAVLFTVAFKMIFGSHSGDARAKKFSSNAYYFDVSSGDHFCVKSSFGEANVFFENTDIPSDRDVVLTVENSFGETMINVPSNFTVTVDIASRFGEVNCRQNTVVGGRKLIIKGSNQFGEVNIR